METLTFKRSRIKTAGFVLGALVFVIGGFFITRSAEELFDRVIGLVCVLFFGAVLVSATRSLFQNQVVFALDQTGITDTNRGLVIAWSEVDEVTIVTVRGIRFLGLALKSPDSILARVSPMQRRLAGMNEQIGGAHWSFSFAGITPGIDDALQFIRQNVPGVRALRA